MPTITSITETVKGLIEDAVTYKEEAKTIWEELEETEDEGDKTFYKKFGEKVTSSITLSEHIKDKIVKAKVHIKHILEEHTSNSGRKKSVDYSNQENTLPILARALRGLQTLISDHGVALEFLRELFVQQNEKISEVEAKVLHPGVEHIKWMENTVAKEVEEKTKELSDKLEKLEEKVVVVEANNTKLEEKNKKLEEECDEVRQRGMKGNLRISCPPRRGQERRDTPATVEGKRESLTEMNLRLIKETSGAQIMVPDVVNCHRVPENDFTYIIRVANLGPGSGWETLAAGMLSGQRAPGTGGKYFADNGVYISFQLTETRAKVHNQLRLLRKEKKLISKFSVNQNGRMTIRREKSPRTTQGAQARETWEVVKDMAALERMFPEVSFPLAAPARTPAAAAAVTAAARVGGTS